MDTLPELNLILQRLLDDAYTATLQTQEQAARVYDNINTTIRWVGLNNIRHDITTATLDGQYMATPTRDEPRGTARSTHDYWVREDA